MAELSRVISIQSTPEEKLYKSPSFQGFKNKAMALAIALGMLPILAVGSALDYFGHRSIDQQIMEAKREGATQLAAVLAQQKERLAILLLGTGATALLSGALAALWTTRTLRSAMTAAANANAQAARQNRSEGAQQFAEAVYAIRHARTQAEILKAAVEEVRKAINSDRVIVYALDPDGAGTVIAESVDPKWPKALRARIDDPCFSSQYTESYQRGRVKATDDIYAAGLTPCHIGQLEAFAVRANLVAPILNGDQLFGLLIAHQCASPRVWRQFEVDLFTQAANHVGISLDNAKFQAQAASEAKIAQAFRTDVHRFYESLNQADIFQTAVEACRKMIGVDRVIVCTLDQTVGGVVTAESVAAGWPKILQTPIKDPYFGDQPIEVSPSGWVKVVDDIFVADLPQSYSEQLDAFAVKAYVAAPILKQGEVVGLLIAQHCSGSRAWQPFETRWFSQLAAQVGFALNTAALFAENTTLQKEAAHEIEWKAFLTDATRQIHASLNREDVLKSAVEEARRVLTCDRVLIYSVDRESKGIVIAESVGGNWPQALGRTIEDPCFEARYIKNYENGRVRALNNIYEGGMTQCYIDQLEVLSVKANLVAPVLHEGKLLGIIVAHQCSGPRVWKPLEIGWFTQIAVQVGYALDNAKLVGRVTEMAQEAALEVEWKGFFMDATRQIHASLSREDVLKSAVEEARRVLTCDRVLIYSVDRESKGIVIAESVGGNWPQALGRTIEDPCFEARYIKSYENGRVRALNNIYQGGITQCYLDQLEVLSVKANLVAPVLHEGKLLGIMVAHQCSGPRVWKPLEIDWFTQIAVQVGYALDNAKLVGHVNQMAEEAALEIEWKTFFMDATRQIHASLSREDVLKTAVEEARRVLICDRVLIFSVDRESQGIVIAESVGSNWPKALGRTIEDPCFEARYIKQYENGRVRALNNIYEDGITQCYLDQLEILAVKANLVVPVLHEGKLLGIMVAHQCSGPRVWKSLEIGWFTQLAVQVGYALDNAKLIGRVNQMSLEAEIQQQMAALLKDSEAALNTLSEEARSQTLTVESAIAQIQTVTESAQEMVTTAHQAELQIQKTDQTIQISHELISQTVDSISILQEMVMGAAAKSSRLGQSSQQIAKALSLINDLTLQMNQQVMNVAITAGRTGDGGQMSVLSVAETIRSLSQQLAETTAITEPLVLEIEAEANALAADMEIGAEQALTETELTKETQNKLGEIAAVSAKMSMLVGKIAQAAAGQVKTSTAASRAASNVANFTHHTSEQSTAVVQSLTTLALPEVESQTPDPNS